MNRLVQLQILGMKPIQVISFILAFSPMISWAQGLVVNAGRDTVVCIDSLDTLYLGGYPTAIGGTQPYSYTWYTEPWIFSGFPQLSKHTSYWLSDTTVANPILKFLDLEDSTRQFRVTVVDSLGQSAHDWVSITACGNGPVPLGNSVIYPTVGDTVTFSVGNSFSCAIDSITWEHPKEFVVSSNPNGSITVVIDRIDFQYPIATAHNAQGCEVFQWMNPLVVEVYPLGFLNEGEDRHMSVFPNPADEVIEINGIRDRAIIRLMSLDGTIVLEQLVNSGYEVDISMIPQGIYLISVSDSTQINTKRLVVSR